jgi:Spy/CpxP family protein refolding chaperone
MVMVKVLYFHYRNKKNKEFKMNKKILGTGLLVAVLTVAGYAHGGAGDQDGNGGMMQGQGMMNQSGTMYNQNRQGQMSQRGNMQNQQGMIGQRGMMGGQSGMMGKGMMGQMMGQMMSRQRGMMSMFQNLNLNNDQRYKISILREEMRLDMRKLMGPNHRKEMFSFVTANGFDKAGFKKEARQIHDKMLNIKANNMEKMFKILTKEQIVQLKKNIAQ